ncbi:MAG: TolC family protein [Acidobacteria bacterium]|nr:TolC family protein [Acidobacteriota bacterium]
MNKHLFSVILFVFLLSFTEIKAQDASPSPTPKVEEMQKIDDKQNVQPENLQGVPKIAPNYQSDDKTLPDLGLVGVDLMQQKPLSLKEAIALALENNKDIEVSRQNVRLAEFDLTAADGFYEPRFSGNTQYERATIPNVSIFSTNKTTTSSSIVGNARYQGFIKKFGTIYAAELNNSRLGTNNPISILSPQYNTGLTLSVTQPLLRGRRFDNQRRIIEIAKRNLSLTDTQFRQRSIEIITTVQRAYWDLTFSLRNLQVQRDGVRDAKDQLEHNRRLVEEGQLAPVDIIAAQTQVANFEQSVYIALEEVGRAENNLKNLIAENRNDSIWSVSIVPTDSVELDTPNTTLPEALELALQNRPEIELNTVARDINEIDRRFYREQTKPQVDLVASYTSAGIGGSENANFRSPFGTVCDPNTPDYQTCLLRQQRVQFNIPLGNKTAKAQLGRTLVEGERIKTQREQVEQNIQVDVRNALQTVRTSEARLRSAAISRENTEKQYASEQRKLDAGQSDIYKVLERQTALTTARSNELRAQTELNKAIAELQRATGNSMKANNVEARLRR